MTCSCGDVMTTTAASRDEAVKKIQGKMDEPTINAHMSQRHQGEPVPSVEQIHMMIAQGLKDGETKPEKPGAMVMSM